jgi:predicted TIM-barrel fold metal-dependent hydrolase
VAAPYAKVVSALRVVIGDLGAAQQDAVFGGNAIRIYELGDLVH